MTDFEYPAGATPIDPDEADGLLLTHITSRGELNLWEQRNIADAMDWARKTGPTDILNEKFVRDLHRRMFNTVWRWAGEFRRSDKNIGVPWPEIRTGLSNFFDDVQFWLERREESDDEIAVRFHHRLVSIHPFPNGNGRHARLMTEIFQENVLHCPRFTWGGRNLSKSGETRTRYIEALQGADGGDSGPLIEFARS